MLSLVLATTLLSGYPEAQAAKQLAIDANDQRRTLEAAVNPAYQLVVFKQSAAQGSYLIWRATHPFDVIVGQKLTDGNNMLNEATAARNSAMTLTSFGTQRYGIASLALMRGDWIDAADEFGNAKAAWDQASEQWNIVCAKSALADAKFDEVLDATK